MPAAAAAAAAAAVAAAAVQSGSESMPPEGFRCHVTCFLKMKQF
jgi:hypothetical protein